MVRAAGHGSAGGAAVEPAVRESEGRALTCILLVPPDEEEEKRKKQNFLEVARGSSVLTPRLLVFTARQVFAAAQAATPVSVCVTAESWNDFTGGVMFDWHPGGLFFRGLKMSVDFVPSPVFQHVLCN